MIAAHLTDLVWLGPLVLALILLWQRRQAQKPAIIATIIGKVQQQRRFGAAYSARLRGQTLRYSAILILLAIVLLRPQWGKKRQEVSRKGVDIMFVVDVSLSMNADDLPPTRLQRAEREIKDLVADLKGDRVGLISFAGASFLQCPLTLDYSSFRLFLDELQPGMIPAPGTDISKALLLAGRAFRKESTKSKVIVLVTDGEDHADMGQKALAALTEQGISVYVVSFGTATGAPVKDPSSGRFLKDGQGKMVISKPDFAGLEQLAQAAGGSLWRSTPESYGLAHAYEALKSKLEDNTLKASVKEVYDEGYLWFLGLALTLMVADALLRARPLPTDEVTRA